MIERTAYRLAYAAVSVAAILVAFFSLSAGLREAALARHAALDRIERFQSLRGGLPERGLSLYGDRTLLDACDGALAGPLSDLVPEAELARIAAACKSRAAEIANATPTWSLGHYVSALASYRLGEDQAALSKLSISQQLHPHSTWLAERRVSLAQRLTDPPATIPSEAVDGDLGLLLSTERGRSIAARLFVSDPRLRGVIADVADEIDPSARADFLAQVRMERIRIDER